MKKPTTETKAMLKDLQKRKHSISATSAKEMVANFSRLKAELGKPKKTAVYFDEKDPVFPKSIAINKKALADLLAQPNCVGLRFYPALNAENKFTLVVLAIDAAGENIFQVAEKPAVMAKSRKSAALAAQDVEQVVDEGQMCPPYAPPSNDL
ncbi:MAG: hypothetical protein EAY75_17465 [Bacteroidetes bacterium]|nr:MAG: hypothetical protein EAY75_17465 [Bacteroidota bacterium]